MAHFILIVIGAIVVGVIGFGITWLVAGRDPGLSTIEPDDKAVPLPSTRPLAENDVAGLRFDTTMRGYRMGQVDAALRRAAYDIGYKQELINVLEAENEALRDGRMDDAESLREARSASVEGVSTSSKSREPRVERSVRDQDNASADGAEAEVTEAGHDAEATEAGHDAEATEAGHDAEESTAEHVTDRDGSDVTKIDTAAVVSEFDPRRASAGRTK
jgi:DivIVA domain-containing protein